MQDPALLCLSTDATMFAEGQGSLCVAVLWGPQGMIQDAQLTLGASFYPTHDKMDPKSSPFLIPLCSTRQGLCVVSVHTPAVREL